MAHVNARAGEEGVKGWFAPETLQQVYADLQRFWEARKTDVKQIVYIAKDCDKLPKRVTDAVTGMGGGELIPKAAAAATMAGAAAGAANAAKSPSSKSN